MRIFAARLALVAIGTALAFVLAEFVLIVANVAPLPPRNWRSAWSVQHELFGWWYVPGVEFRYDGRYQKFGVLNTINTKGLREREYPYEKENGVFRILILGDSLTASFEVLLEQTWHEILETGLNDGGLRPARVEIIAAGIQGWSTDQQYLYYLHEGYRFRPDLVLLQFYPNDIYGNGLEVQQLTKVPHETDKPFFTLGDVGLVLTDPFRTERESQVAAPNGGLLGRAKGFLRNHLRTYRVVRQARLARAESRRPRIPFCYEYRGVPPELFTYAREFPREYKAAWEVTSRLIKELKRETGRRGQRFAVLYMSDRRQVLSKEWQRTLQCWPAAARLSWDLDKPNHLLKDLLTQINVPYLDLTATFREMASAGRSIYFENDWHLNADGHRLVSSVLGDWLRRESLIP